jgi:hypothetical protein
MERRQRKWLLHGNKRARGGGQRAQLTGLSTLRTLPDLMGLVEGGLDLYKEARRAKPGWVSRTPDEPEWQKLAQDRLGWRKMLKSIERYIRTWPVLPSAGQQMSDEAQDGMLMLTSRGVRRRSNSAAPFMTSSTKAEVKEWPLFEGPGPGALGCTHRAPISESGPPGRGFIRISLPARDPAA